MLGTKKIDPNLDTVKLLDEIEKAVYARIRPYGFRKHGRTLHRFVDGDISQVINFQLGQAYLGYTHLLSVNLGIRVPECMNRNFLPDQKPKKYYHEYECNIRSRLGEIEGNEVSCYDLRQPQEETIKDILRQIEGLVLPVFEKLSSREAILSHRKDYPSFDRLNNHLIHMEEAMIYGRQGNLTAAAAAFNLGYRLTAAGQTAQKDRRVIRSFLQVLDALAAELGIEIERGEVL